MRKMIEKHALVLHLALTFASSWALWLASGVLRYDSGLPPLDRGWLIAQVGVFCPSLWAIALTAYLRPDLRRHCLGLLLGVFTPVTLLGLVVAERGVGTPNDLPPAVRILVLIMALAVLAVFLFFRRLLLVERRRLQVRSLGWCLAAACQLPFCFLLAWLIVNAPRGDFGVEVFTGGLAAALPGVAVLFAFDLVFGGALGEEIGWRAFALPRMLSRWSPLRSALLLGAVWALWHLPIDLAVGFGAAGVGGVVFRLLFTCSLSVVVVWYFLRSGHGMLSSLLIHTTLNWLPVLEFTNYEAAMGVLFVMMFLFGLLVAFGDRRMRQDPSSLGPAARIG